VTIAVEGSSSQVERPFFAPTGIYAGLSWELADAADEAAIRALIDGKRRQDAASAAAAQAEMERRRAAREAAEREAASLRTAEAKAEARARLIAAYRTTRPPEGWDLILRDLRMVQDEVDREVDRGFVADLFDRRRGIRFPFPSGRPPG